MLYGTYQGHVIRQRSFLEIKTFRSFLLDGKLKVDDKDVCSLFLDVTLSFYPTVIYGLSTSPTDSCVPRIFEVSTFLLP